MSETLAWGTVKLGPSARSINRGSDNWNIVQLGNGRARIEVKGSFATDPVVIATSNQRNDCIISAIDITDDTFQLTCMDATGDDEHKMRNLVVSFFAIAIDNSTNHPFMKMARADQGIVSKKDINGDGDPE